TYQVTKESEDRVPTGGSGKHGYGAKPPRVNSDRRDRRAYRTGFSEPNAVQAHRPRVNAARRLRTRRLTRCRSIAGRNPAHARPVRCNPVTPFEKNTAARDVKK